MNLFVFCVGFLRTQQQQQSRDEIFVEHARPVEPTGEYYSKENVNVYSEHQQEDDSQSSRVSEANNQDTKIKVETVNEPESDLEKVNSPRKVHDTSSFINSVSDEVGGENQKQEREEELMQNNSGEKVDGDVAISECDDVVKIENGKAEGFNGENCDGADFEVKKLKVDVDNSTAVSS